MADYRRYFVPGGSFFFTLVTQRRAKLFAASMARKILGEKLRQCKEKWPFEVNAIVLLPDHLHAIWSLPPGDARYDRRWGWTKKEFSKQWIAHGGAEQPVSHARKERNERGIWQRRSWEHTIRDENDFERHFDYIHYNPVKHGYVDCPKDWPHSSFHRWVKRGIYDPGWGCQSRRPLTFDDLDETAME